VSGTTSKSDDLVQAYFRALDQALTGVPEGQKNELVEDLREHIETQRGTMTSDSEAEVRQILARLGSPETVAAAARNDQPTAAVQPTGWLTRRRIILAVVALLAVMVVAAFLFFAFFLIAADSGPSDSSQPAGAGTPVIMRAVPPGTDRA
jgi:uncharacterized membrane protein